MKKLIKSYLTKLKENENKGFSLVELIIVMAIMAILVGVVASQVIPYMEKSRQAKDQQILSAVLTDLESAVAQSGEGVAGGTAAAQLTETNFGAQANTKAVSEFNDLRSASDFDTVIGNVENQFKSKLYKGGNINFLITYSTGKIEVFVPAQDGKGKTTLTGMSSSDKNYVCTE